MYTETELFAMNVADLKAYGRTIYADVKGNLSEATLVSRIMAKQNEPDFVDPAPKEEIELVKPEFESPVLVLDNGTVHTAEEVVEAAQRDSGLTAEAWNELPPVEIAETVQEFVDHTNFLKPEPVIEAEPKDYAEYVKRFTEIMADYPEVGFETQANFFTLTYMGKINSGNITIPETVLRHTVQVMLQV